MIAYRPADQHDHRFIVDSWVSSYREADTAGMIHASDWYGVMIPQVNRVLARPDVSAVVAHESDDPDRGADLYGWIVADVTTDPPCVFYAFVKAAYRRLGVARGLFGALGIDPLKPFAYVCSTPMTHRLRVKIPLARWRPRLGRFDKNERTQQNGRKQ